jgi:Na+-transporting methylmalonyl-CoA/oxaloacetate decarboxylase gamma subunit
VLADVARHTGESSDGRVPALATIYGDDDEVTVIVMILMMVMVLLLVMVMVMSLVISPAIQRRVETPEGVEQQCNNNVTTVQQQCNNSTTTVQQQHNNSATTV